MKNIYIIAVLATAMAVSSCGGSANSNSDESTSTGKKFAPKEKESTMSDEGREARIAEKRLSLIDMDIDSLMVSHGVKFSVLPPAASENLSKDAAEKLGTKMIQIAAKNGVGGLCTNPVLAMVARVDCVDRSLTGTAPQKAIVKYDVTMYCGNFITNDIYASVTQTITGVGANFDEAGSKAIDELKDDSKVQQMLATASERAIKWYGSTANVKSVVDNAVAEKKYDLAMALLSSVPEQATATYSYASKRNEEVSNMFFQEKAAELLGGLEDAIAAAGDDYNPEIGAYLKVIPPRSSSYARAKAIYDDYVKRVRAVNDDKRAKEYQLAMEQLAVEKIKAPYEAQATIAQIEADAKVGVAQARAEGRKNANTGGFLGLGKLWDGGYGLVNRIMDKFE